MRPAATRVRSDDRDAVAKAGGPAQAIASSTTILLSVIAVALLGYLAYGINTIDSIIDESLPCTPSVILDTDPIIDPAGYNLYSSAEVEASQAYDRCMKESRDLFAAEGAGGLSNIVSWPSVLLTDVLAGLLLASSWAVAIAAAIRRLTLVTLSLLTLAAVVAVSFQIQHSGTIELVSWITK